MVKPLRDELYCQLIKQLSNNTNPSSRSKGWDLMLLCIAHFPPNGEMENYLEMFLRTKAQPPDKYVNMHHQTLYHGERNAPPTEADIQQILQGGQVERSISSLPREQVHAAPRIPFLFWNIFRRVFCLVYSSSIGLLSSQPGYHFFHSLRFKLSMPVESFDLHFSARLI